MNIFKNKTILITGGSGSWGNKLIRKLLRMGVKKIISFSRNEFKQVSLKRKFNDPLLKIIIGDVRDYGKINFACRDVNIVFHLAAIKHVPICEEFPYEAIKTNINGTRNVVRSAIDNGVDKVIDVSSDKACSPLNFYGMTKAVGEKLIINAAKLSKKTKFMVIRGGNAMGSNGSVIPLFINQIKKYNKVLITDGRMTRFFITLSEAVDLLFAASESNINGGLFVMKMPACSIVYLAKVLIKHYGDKATKLEEIGIRPGEKIDEVLVSKDEAIHTYKYKKDYYLIYPQKKLKLKKVDFVSYNSSQDLMTMEQIEKLLNKGGFLK